MFSFSEHDRDIGLRSGGTLGHCNWDKNMASYRLDQGQCLLQVADKFGEFRLSYGNRYDLLI